MEIALRTEPDSVDILPATKTKPERTIRRRRGDILVAIPMIQTRFKWVEKIGRLMSPALRHRWTVPNRDAVLAKWNRGWFDAWYAMERERSLTPEQAWQVILNSGLPDLGKDPRGTTPRVDTWFWTKNERRIFLLGNLDSEDVSLAERGHSMRDGVWEIGYRGRIDYRTGLGFSSSERVKIEDRNHLRDPKLDEVWSRGRVRKNFEDVDSFDRAVE